MSASHQPFNHLPSSDWSQLEPIVKAFEEAQQRGEKPTLADYLPPNQQARLPVLVELVHADLEFRLKAKEAVRVESYLEHFPELIQSTELILNLVTAEYELRRRLENDLLPTEYLHRFPQFQEELRSRLAIGMTPEGDTDQKAPISWSRTPEPATGPYVSKEPVEQTEGHTVPGYELLGILGRGGMGVVYKARQVKLKRLVALKMIRSQTLARPEELERFRIEAEALASLQHPNIVQIYEVNEFDGLPYFSLEFVDGGSLHHQLESTPQPARPSAQLVETLARAMHAAHKSGIIHRDLKPANVLVSSDGTPKITDFGLAKQLDDDSGQTHSGQILGTPSYMAPEQALGRIEQIGPVTDVYALGAILYEMVTGRPPFKGASPWETLDLVRSQDPVPPSRLQPKTPRDLETICLKCLRKDPRERYASADALADDLHRFLNHQPIQARPTPPWERALKWAKREPKTAGLYAAVAVIVLGGLAAYHMYVQQQVSDLQHRETVRTQVDDLLADGERALGAQDWETATVSLGSAVTQIGLEPSLADIKARAENLLAQAERGANAQKARKQAQVALQQFRQARNQAFFHASQVTGLEEYASREKTRQAAEAALKLFGLARSDSSTLALEDAPYSVSEKQEIADGCYELLLTWANALAQPLKSEDGQQQVRAALAILDRMSLLARYHSPTRAYHLRRADYHTELGEEEAAREQRRLAQALEGKQAVAADHFLMGNEHYQRKELATAIHDYENAVRQQPNHFWAHYALAISYLQSQPPLPERAVDQLTTCATLRADFNWTYLLRGFARGEVGARALVRGQRTEADFQFAAAEQDFQEVLQRKPNRDEEYNLYVNRGVTRIRRKHYPEAVTDLERALQLKPDQFAPYINLAQAYQEQGQLDEAIRQLDRAIQRHPRAALLYRTRCWFLLKKPDPVRAEADFDQAHKLDASGNPAFTAQYHTERAQSAYQKQRYREAIEACASALGAVPNSTPALRVRAGALIRLEDYPAAILSFNAYLSQSNGQADGEAYEGRGLAQAKLGNYAAAIDDFSRALQLLQTAAQRPNGLVASKRTVGDLFEEAARTLETKRKIASIHGHRGWAYLLGGATKLALNDFEEASRLDPANGDAFNGRGFARVKLGQYRPGVADAEEALRLGPKTQRMVYNAARIYGQAVAALETDPTQRGKPQFAQTHLQFQARALELTREALEFERDVSKRARFWKETVAADDALKPLRGSTGFQQLAARFATTAK